MRKMRLLAALLMLSLPGSALFAANGPVNGEKTNRTGGVFLAQEAIDEDWLRAQPTNCHPFACHIQLAPGTEMSEAFVPVSTHKTPPRKQEKARRGPIFEDHTVE